MALPKTFSSGERLFASDLNSNFEDLDGRDLEDLANVSGSPASGDKLVFNGSAWEPLAGYIYAGTRYYTSSGTFAKADPLGTGDIGLRAVKVTVTGAGGAGGGSQATSSTQNSAGGGGGSGATGISFILASSLSASETVTVGSGGVAGVGVSGGSGGTSSFKSITAGGGTGGSTAISSSGNSLIVNAGDAGSVSGADLNLWGAGASGGIMSSVDNTNGGQIGGPGASSYFGGGGNAGYGGTGKEGRAPGAGGGGAAERDNSPARIGGAGEDGIVIIECYV